MPLQTSCDLQASVHFDQTMMRPMPLLRTMLLKSVSQYRVNVKRDLPEAGHEMSIKPISIALDARFYDCIGHR